METNEANPNQTAAPMGITAVGVDERMQYAISLFFKYRLEERYRLVDPQDADIWLFDVDHADGRSEWSKHPSARPGIPAILVSIDEIDPKGTHNVAFARKPLSAELLKEVLEQLDLSGAGTTNAVPMQTDTRTERSGTPASSDASLMSASNDSTPGPETFMPDTEWYQESTTDEDALAFASAKAEERKTDPDASSSGPGCYAAAMKLGEQHTQVFIGSTPDIDADDPSQLEKAQFDPDGFLVGAVGRAAAMATQAQRPVRISGRGWVIVVRPNPDRVFVDSKKLQLRTLATLPLQDDVKTELVDQEESGKVFAGVKWRLAAFQWTLSLMAARGRVPFGTDLKVKVKLKHWPNLTRLQAFPNAMRIASLWSREPLSLVESARVLGIPQRYVFSFYSAGQALGIMESVHTVHAEQSRSGDQPVKRHRSLFRKILSHLRLG